MKRVFRKNQFLVTMLAVLIAVAGYLNYTDKLVKDDKAKEVNNTYDTVYEGDDLLTSDSDILSMDVDSMQVDNENDLFAANDSAAKESESQENEDESISGENNKDIVDENGELLGSNEIEGYETETEEPGAAVLTSGVNFSDFTIKARLNREQTRSKNKETLLEVINNESIPNEQKQEAIDAMVEMTETSELENNIETVLEAKGFSDVIVTLSEEQADVIINTAQVADSDRAQIEDVITRKTDLEISNIIITPMTES